jgi:hypothetical protein
MEPEKPKTQEEKIDFIKAYDALVELNKGKQPPLKDVLQLIMLKKQKPGHILS